MKLHGPDISKTELWCSVSQFPCTFKYPWAIYIFPGSVCLFYCSQIGRTILEYIYRSHSQIHECRIWERGRTVLFLGVHKSDFRYSAEYDECTFSVTHEQILCHPQPQAPSISWSPTDPFWKMLQTVFSHVFSAWSGLFVGVQDRNGTQMRSEGERIYPF